MKRRFALMCCLLVLGACTTPPEARLRDQGRLRAVKTGMKKKYVLLNMGTELLTARDTKGDIRAIIPNPYSTEKFESGDKSYEVLYYFVNPNPKDGAVTDDELEPLVFENDRISGRGWEYYRSIAIGRK